MPELSAARRRGARWGLGLAAAALLLAGCATSLPAPVGAASARGSVGERELIQRLLDRRARAVLEGDEPAFMATVSKADPAFAARQRRLFRWARGVPFSSYRLVAQWDLLGDLARPSDRARYPAAESVALPLTQERYTLGAYDAEPAVEDLFLTFVKEGGRWLVASTDDLADVGLVSSRHLWDFGPVQERRSEHFSLLSHPCGSRPGCPALSEDLLGLAESALRRVEQRWSAPWRKQVVVMVPTTQDELGEIVQATVELDDFVAFATSTVDVERGFGYGGHRVLLNPAGLATRSQESLLVILAHELLHVASRSVSGPLVPTFVEEGLAEYVGRGADDSSLAYLESHVSSGGFDRSLPDNWEFLTGSGTDIFLSYQEAQSAIRFLAERWGERKLVSFYRSLGRARVAPGTSAYHLDRSLRGSIGVGTKTFERLWADSITGG